MGLGNQIKYLLEIRGMTILELSEKTGISKNTLYAITKRDSKNVRLDNLQKIATVLEVDVDTLIGWDKEKPITENLTNSPVATQLTITAMKEGIEQGFKRTLTNKTKPKETSISPKENMETIAVYCDDDSFTKEELEEIRRYIDFVKNKRG